MNQTATANLQSQRIYEQLRRAIVTCDLQPEARLRVVDIAGREAVSPGAVREALSALVSEHLVVPLPQRGFRVAPMAKEDMRDLFTTRADLESHLAACSTRAGQDGWRSALALAWEQMAAFGKRPTIGEGAAAAHERFHRTLVADCGSIWSLRLFETVYTASERYRFYAYRYLTGGRDPHQEHSEILDAALRGDDTSVGTLCKQHILRTRALLDESL